MKIKKQTKKPVLVSFDVDSIEIVTRRGSQSTDYSVVLRNDEEEIIHDQDVRSLEDGLIWCAHNLLNNKHRNLVLGVCDIPELPS